MKLTELIVINAKPAIKQYKLADGGGLFMLVHPNGGKYWRFSYRYAGKQQTLALGVYPDVTLAEARDRRKQARKLLANDADPGEVKRIKKQQRKIISSKPTTEPTKVGEFLDSKEAPVVLNNSTKTTSQPERKTMAETFASIKTYTGADGNRGR